jgi:hypothetical protein
MEERTMHTRLISNSAALLAVVAVLCTFIAQPAQAQSVGFTTQPGGFTASLPVSKVISNTCSGKFELVNGTLSVGVSTTTTTSGFSFAVQLTSTGTAQDVNADGTAALNPLPQYQYSGSLSADAGYPSLPSSNSVVLPMRDYLIRTSNSRTDIIALTTSVEVDFTNGIPTGASIVALSSRCQ